MRQYQLFSYKGANYRIASSAFDVITEELKRLRTELEIYITLDPAFLHSLVPHVVKPPAPEIARVMAAAGEAVGVGPMAAVAGAFAEAAARKALSAGAMEAIIENGGDIFLASTAEVVVGIYAGAGALSKRLAFRITKADMPISLCSSSSTMGHSLSLGDCDLATVIAEDAALADAAATFACNSVKHQTDIEPTLERVMKIKGVRGVLIVKGDRVGMAGQLPELVGHSEKDLTRKVTRDRGNREFISID
jgi:ApbE superfamily uncharacterized protein (UPF0280 family)